MGLRIDIGSGFKKEEGLIRLDIDPKVKPDYVVNLETDNLPFDDNSVEYVKAHHILEHLGEGFFHCMQEIYRVCENGAIVEVEVPYFRHYIQYADPTHRRAITGFALNLFSKKNCDWSMKVNESSSGTAYDYDVDFEIVTEEIFFDPDYKEEILERESKVMTEEDGFRHRRWLFDTNNLIYSIRYDMKVIK